LAILPAFAKNNNDRPNNNEFQVASPGSVRVLRQTAPSGGLSVLPRTSWRWSKGTRRRLPHPSQGLAGMPLGTELIV